MFAQDMRHPLLPRAEQRCAEFINELAALNERFDPLLAADRIAQTGALEEESEDHHLHHMPRIVLVPHKRDFGKIRLLLNAINELPARRE